MHNFWGILTMLRNKMFNIIVLDSSIDFCIFYTLFAMQYLCESTEISFESEKSRHCFFRLWICDFVVMGAVELPCYLLFGKYYDKLRLQSSYPNSIPWWVFGVSAYKCRCNEVAQVVATPSNNHNLLVSPQFTTNEI